MKATIVLIADNDAENYGRKLMLEAHRCGADYESYQRAYDELRKSDYNQTFRFSKLGLLYYDDDNITPGTYFCYKVCDL